MLFKQARMMLAVLVMALVNPGLAQDFNAGRKLLLTDSALGRWLEWSKDLFAECRQPGVECGGGLTNWAELFARAREGNSMADMPTPAISPSPSPGSPPADANGGGSCDDPLVADMIAKHNEYRSNGPLTCNNGGSKASMDWSKEMCSMKTLSHANAKKNVEAAGFTQGWAENVLYNYAGRDGTVEKGFEQWRTSPGHDANMRGDYEGIGCGWYQCDDDSIYWTCIYGNGASNGGAGDDAGAPALTPTSDPPSKNLQSPPTDDFDADGDDMDEPFSPPADPAATPTSGEDGAPPADVNGGGSCADPMVKGMIAKHNEYRRNGPLTCNNGGSKASMEWSRKMCSMGTLSHAGFEANVNAAGFTTASAENVLFNMAGRDGTVEEGFEQWRTSPGHDANMRGDYEGVGCGWYDCGNRRIYWTCVYGNGASNGGAGDMMDDQLPPPASHPTTPASEPSPNPTPEQTPAPTPEPTPAPTPAPTPFPEETNDGDDDIQDMPAPEPEDEMPTPPFTPPPIPTPGAPSDDGNGDASGGGSCSDPMVADMIAKHNAYRTNGDLTCNDGGSKASMDWSKEMCSMGTLSHAGFDVNVKAAGFTTAYAENVLFNMAGRDGTVEEGFEQWRTSPGHDANMRGDYEGVGCGWWDCGNRRIYWTCVYGNGASNGGGGDGSGGGEPTPTPPSNRPPTLTEEETPKNVPEFSEESAPEPEEPEETPQQTPAPPPPPSGGGSKMEGGSCSDPLVADMINKHNAYRTNGPLTCNDGGSQECMKWSQQMCQMKSLSHANAQQNADAAGFSSAWGENVLYNYGGMDGTVERGFEQWRTSPGHDANMRGDFEGVGCGWYQCDDDSIYWTCIYGTP